MSNARPLRGFAGFRDGASGTTAIPTAFFAELLPLIDDLAELKLTTYLFWALQQREGEHRFVRLADLQADTSLLQALSDKADAGKTLVAALERATARGTLLHVAIPPADDLYFMNTERGRRGVAALERGDWTPGERDAGLPTLERPNIFTLYEQNIGPLTPLLSEILRDAENTYPTDWINDALKIAIENNKRNWRYVEAILKGWTLEGRNHVRRKNLPNQDISPFQDEDYLRRHGLLDEDGT